MDYEASREQQLHVKRQAMDRYIHAVEKKITANPPLVLFSPEEVLMKGLHLVYTSKRIYRVKGAAEHSPTNRQRFIDHYSASHEVISHTWADLQTTENPRARIKALDFSSFLEALNFNCRYKRESEREAQFDESPKTLRKWAWCHLMKIRALAVEKIVFPDADEFDESEDWAMTVDGTHSLWNEPDHPEFSQDDKACSHKKKHAGLGYELGIHLFEPRLIWMCGSFYAGKGDNGNFEEGGLRARLKAIGKKALADKAYNGCPDECSTFNALDCDAVKQLKARAQMRHEQFNGMLKQFSSLDDRHRHKQEKFEVCFEAACVICQCRMEHGEPLFDLLAGIEFDNEADQTAEI